MNDILIKNVKLVDVVSQEIYETGLSVKDGKIVDSKEKAKVTIDGKGKYAVPGLMDAHVHVESSFLSLTQFSKLILSKGTTTIIADPHEICNVLGLDGLKFLIKESETLPFNSFFMVPSSIPATNLGTSGATIGVEEIKEGLKLKNVLGLGEVMVHPKLSNSAIEKIQAAKGKIINGHAPGMRGEDLKNYIEFGIYDDHESLSAEEIVEKIEAGMDIMIREGSAASSPKEFYKLIEKYPDKFMFCIDDKHVNDIVSNGYLDFNIRKAISFGIDPLLAIKCATINTAKHFKLDQLGSLDIGKKADILLLDDLKKFNVKTVIFSGKIIWNKGKYSFNFKHFDYPKKVLNSIRRKKISEKGLELKRKGVANIIKANEHSLFTDWIKENIENDYDLKKDILKICVVDRYHENGNISVGLINGFGMKRGAIATSYSHDCHNIVAIGTNDEDIVKTVNEIIKNNGGLVVFDRKVKRLLKLPIAGMMTNENFKEVTRDIEDVEKEAKKIGCKLKHPFATLSFMSLEVIPRLKLTDKGLVDVNNFRFVGLIE